MTDPLNDALLISTDNRRNASGLVRTMTDEMPTSIPLYPLLTALCSLLVGLCERHDMDPEAVLSQVADTLTSSPDHRHTLDVIHDMTLGLH